METFKYCVSRNSGSILLLAGAIFAIAFQPALLTAYVLGLAFGFALVSMINTYFQYKSPLVQSYRFAYFAFVGMFSMLCFAVFRTHLVFDINWFIASVAALISCVSMTRLLIHEYLLQLKQIRRNNGRK